MRFNISDSTDKRWTDIGGHFLTLPKSDLVITRDVIAVLESWGGERRDTEIEVIRVTGAGEESVNCDYLATSAASIPRGFIDVCLVTCDILS